jgi:hypothetical protein
LGCVFGDLGLLGNRCAGDGQPIGYILPDWEN